MLTETVTLAHPLIPFVTEEIYSYIPGAEGLLAAARSPRPQPASIDDAEAEDEVERAIAAIQAVRAWRDAADVKPSAVLPARLRAEGYERDRRAPGAARPARVRRRRVGRRRRPPPRSRSPAA